MGFAALLRIFIFLFVQSPDFIEDESIYDDFDFGSLEDEVLLKSYPLNDQVDGGEEATGPNRDSAEKKPSAESQGQQHHQQNNTSTINTPTKHAQVPEHESKDGQQTATAANAAFPPVPLSSSASNSHKQASIPKTTQPSAKSIPTKGNAQNL